MGGRARGVSATCLTAVVGDSPSHRNTKRDKSAKSINNRKWEIPRASSCDRPSGSYVVTTPGGGQCKRGMIYIYIYISRILDENESTLTIVQASTLVLSALCLVRG